MIVTSESAPAATAPRESPASTPGSAWTRADSIAVLATTALAAGLRLYHLGFRSLWFDEGFSAGIALMKWPDFLSVNSAYSANMAFYYLLLKLWLPLGNSDGWTRGLSALLGIVTVPALYWLARKLFGTTTATSAALLLACNAFHIKYSQEARAYTLVTVLVVASIIAMVRAVERSTTRAWLVWAAVSALAVYAHTYAVLVIGGEILWAMFVLSARDRWKLFAAFRWFVLALVPYLVIMTRGGSGAIAWLRPFTFRQIADTIALVCGNVGWTLPLLFAAACLGAFWMPRDERRAFLLAALLAIAPFVAVIVLYRVKPLLFPRYMIVTLPGIVLMVAAAARRLPRLLAAAWLLVTLSVSLWGTVSYFRQDFLPNDDWRSASAFVLSHRQPGDLVVFYTWQGTLAYHYYWWQTDHSAPRVDPNDLYYSGIADLVQSQPKDAKHVWVLLDHFGGSDPSEAYVRGWFSQHYNVVSETEFRGIAVVEYRMKP